MINLNVTPSCMHYMRYNRQSANSFLYYFRLSDICPSLSVYVLSISGSTCTEYQYLNSININIHLICHFLFCIIIIIISSSSSSSSSSLLLSSLYYHYMVIIIFRLDDFLQINGTIYKIDENYSNGTDAIALSITAATFLQRVQV